MREYYIRQMLQYSFAHRFAPLDINLIQDIVVHYLYGNYTEGKQGTLVRRITTKKAIFYRKLENETVSFIKSEVVWIIPGSKLR